MPVNIYAVEDFNNIDYLCEGVWDLTTQVETLANWLQSKGKLMSAGKYVADIGFEIRKNATGGGGVIRAESMRIMGEIGMDVYLSEYPYSKTESTQEEI